MKVILVAVLLTFPCLLQADALSDMRSALQALKGQAPLSLRVKRYTWKREKGKDHSMNECFDLEDGPKGLRRTDGNPLPDGDWNADGMTNAHLGLLNLLMLASVVDETSDTLDGHPMRKLRVSLLGDREGSLDDKSGKGNLKKFLMELTIWIGPDHLPVAVDKQVEIEGKATLSLTFSSTAKDHRRYMKVRDRLVLVEASSQAQAKAMGLDTVRREIVHCTILRP